MRDYIHEAACWIVPILGLWLLAMMLVLCVAWVFH